jgi:cell wall-associated NlpC family hydrolase
MSCFRLPSAIVVGLAVGACSSLPATTTKTLSSGPLTAPESVIPHPPPADVAVSPDSELMSSSTAVSYGRHRAPRRPSPSASTPHRVVVHLATRHVGRPYAWGGTSPDGFDCSGFVMYVYGRIGIPLPHNVRRQYAYGIPVGRDQLEPGDLVFFDRLRHNGIYIGDGKFVHASQRGGGVKISAVYGHWFRERWTGARRLLPHRAP